MARNNRGGGKESDQDERLGSSGDGVTSEPLLPLVLDDDDPAALPQPEDAYQERRIGDSQYARDDSDRGETDREHDEREVSDAERLELFRLAMFQNQLPALPKMPGYHQCWLTTANPRDSIQGRMRLGYTLIQISECPGWDANVLAAGPYAGCIGVNEMVAAKLPLRLYELYMTEAHHNAPLAEEGKLTATLDAIRSQAQGQSAPITLEDGMAALGKRPRRPKFEGLGG